MPFIDRAQELDRLEKEYQRLHYALFAEKIIGIEAGNNVAAISLDEMEEIIAGLVHECWAGPTFAQWMDAGRRPSDPLWAWYHSCPGMSAGQNVYVCSCGSLADSCVFTVKCRGKGSRSRDPEPSPHNV